MYCLIPRGNSVREDTISERSLYAKSGWVFYRGTPIRKLENQEACEDIPHFTLQDSKWYNSEDYPKRKWRKQYMARIAGVDLPRDKRMQKKRE